MATPNSVKNKIQVLIESANATTGKSDNNLTDGVHSLIAGFGQGSGSGECSGNHVIEVEELPTEDIDETALYKVGDSYYIPVKELSDVLLVKSGRLSSVVDQYKGYGFTVELYYSDNVENIPANERREFSQADLLLPAYYDATTNDVRCYKDGNWLSASTITGATNGGAITDASEAVTNGYYYALIKRWESITPTTEEKTVTPTKSTQIVKPSSAKSLLSQVTVNPIPSTYIYPSGTYPVYSNGIYNVSSYSLVDVKVQDSPQPIEIGTVSTLEALSGVGGIYKYTGESTKDYINGGLYIVESGNGYNVRRLGTTSLKSLYLDPMPYTNFLEGKAWENGTNSHIFAEYSDGTAIDIGTLKLSYVSGTGGFYNIVGTHRFTVKYTDKWGDYAQTTYDVTVFADNGSTVSFKINGARYYTDEGMSWATWVASAYNTGGYTVEAGTNLVKSASGNVLSTSTGASVYGNASIENGGAYTHS